MQVRGFSDDAQDGLPDFPKASLLRGGILELLETEISEMPVEDLYQAIFGEDYSEEDKEQSVHVLKNILEETEISGEKIDMIDRLLVEQLLAILEASF
jgi:hypothetical protein